ncbi:MAG: hypothetical protein KDA41_17320 [Planctomycetales bacterium]|nr:hypothetical protein [Planctomycetales bacterium]
MEPILERIATGEVGVVAVLVAWLLKEIREKGILAERVEKYTEAVRANTEAMKALEAAVRVIAEARR